MKKRIALIIITAIALSLVLSLVADAYTIDDSFRPNNTPFDIAKQEADGTTDAEAYKDTGRGFIVLLQILAGGLLYFAIPIATIMLIFGGLNFVTGSADSEQIEQAKKHVTWTLIGLGLIILSYSAVRAIITILLNSASGT